MENFSELINELLREFAFTHEDIASKTGVRLMTIYRWKKGTVPLSAHQAKVLRVVARERAKRDRREAASAILS
jgi:predicted transcriptional regulator